MTSLAALLFVILATLYANYSHAECAAYAADKLRTNNLVHYSKTVVPVRR